MANRDQQKRNKTRIVQCNKLDGIEYAGLKQNYSQKYRDIIGRDPYGVKHDDEGRTKANTGISRQTQD